MSRFAYRILGRIALLFGVGFLGVIALGFFIPLLGSPKNESQIQAPTVDPNALSNEIDRGEKLLKLGFFDEAAQAFQRARVINPTHIKAIERYRQSKVRAGRVNEVPNITADMVRLYAQSGQPSMANARLDELIAAAPKHPQRYELEELLGRHAVQPTYETSIFDRLRSCFGLLVLIGVAVALSSHRKRIVWSQVAWGVGIQITFGLFIMRTEFGADIFDGARVMVGAILSYTDAGAGFIFGNLYNGLPPNGPVMYTDGLTGDLKHLGFVFAFHVLPTIIFFGALMSILYHLGIVQWVVRFVALGMQKLMKTSGAESLSAAGNIFVGQTEAPLLIRPYVGNMTLSELMAVMVGGFATVAGGVLAAYVRFGIDAGHLLAASVMSAPAALVIAKIMQPEVDTPQTQSGASATFEKTTTNVIDAAAAGASDGLKLALNVAAMLLAFMALVAMFNGLLGYAGGLVGLDLSLRVLFGWFFYPLSWCMGVDTADLMEFGNLLGTKIAVNEFVAYVQLGHLRHVLGERTFIIATYALCGFANFSSIGIQIGGISSIAEHRRSDLARIGLRAMIGGAIASWMTACIAGVLL